ncbi:hypothetical protein Thein_1149 [Thermodesulfatator indicus DSM 15286]|uniref:Outer membrane protein assembly factor BamE domain-containing protein n=1 Tax=Thermodesulfatator indicus (strain DSM 15286 / JCM 11887 / CIR29812) TaxID=667014 RepID=F8A825_THEID|nr:outer membrane protein assembly factor BamE [Thermodesulfatator indicus]AEH45018.1 hypothetical protein Thein_1149 [Thermodesulfatator indicus DSM 15286]
MKRFLYIIIAILALNLTNCTGVPGRNLASDASLVRKGISTKEEVYQLLGKPDQIVKTGSNIEEWYYYEKHKNVWKNLPLIGSHIGTEEIEVLKITFKGDHVIDCIYYVVSRP